MAAKKYYSQFQEDKYLNEIFNKTSGQCLEIGGFDGVTGSTTYYFEKLGWNCIVVEPIPDLYKKIVSNRNCTVLNCAVSDQPGETDFFIAEGVEMLSSLTPDATRIELHKGSLSKIKVKTRTLDSILEEFGVNKIDFISIDIEGHELSALKGFSVAKYNPEILIVENNSLGENTEIEKHFKNHGFVRFKITGCNEWYTNQSNKHLYSYHNIVVANFFEFYRKVILIFKKMLKKFLPSTVLLVLKRINRANF